MGDRVVTRPGEWQAPPVRQPVRDQGRRNGSLWRDRNFALLWAGQSVSELGSQVTMLALPLLATITLHASTFEVALLSVFSSAAFLLVALQAGALVDRLRKKPVLVRSDFARAVLIATIPVAQLFGVLTIWQMYAVALAASVLTVFFDVAYQSYLPVLVTRDQLVEGNSKIAGSSAVAQFAGPGVGGALVAAIGAPYAVIVDAASFLVSGVATAAVRDNERQPAPREAGRRLRDDIREGLSFVVRHPILSRIVGCTGTSNFFSNMAGAVEIVFLVRILHASPTVVGVVYSLAAVGALLGAATAARLARRLGSARIVWLSLAVTEPLLFLAPAAFRGWGVLLVAASSFSMGLGSVVYNVAQVSFRQSICPPALQGRMNASVRFIVWGTMPLGALAGGALGTMIGVRPTLVVAAVGGCASVLWVVFSPLFGMRDFPTEESDALEALMLRESSLSD
ncbi:MAG: hypothetical protein QOE84_1438 [Actinomycetota bacterium]|nr:hypothetical protein [Actinomycetota bacterium]